MSGSEGEDIDDVDDRDEDTRETEEEQLRLRALIECVKSCPALYAKYKKKYCGKKFNKDLAWSTVGAAQTPSITGEQAKDDFYKVRQRFGKEWRKYLAHQKGKSGQGGSSLFVSNWPLFEDCRFLGDHITPRKNTYKSVTTTPLPKSSSSVRKTLLQSSVSSPARSPSTSDCSMSSLWNTDFDIMTGSGSNQAPSDESSASCSKPTASEQVLAAMEKAAKSTSKRAPKPDGFASKRQKADKEFMDTMIAQGNALTKFATAFGKALEASPTAPPPVSAQPQPSPLLAAIQFALDSVPEESKLMCLTDVLTLISTKYARKS